MAIDLKSLKISLASKVRRLAGELTLPGDKRQLIRDLFSADERKQTEAAVEIGKTGDVRLLAMMQFYLQDDFLDELLLHFSGKGYHYEFAQKRMIKFYSLMAASNMLMDAQFFDSVVAAIRNSAEGPEERCDLIYMMGSVFEEFGHEIHSRDAAFVSQKIGNLFVRALLELLSMQAESEEVKVASAMSLKKTIQNPSISTDLDPQLAKAVFGKLQEYGDVAQ